MTYRALPTLNETRSVDPSKAKQDKVEITFGQWFLEADREEAAQFACELAHSTVIDVAPEGQLGRRRVSVFNTVRGLRTLKVRFTGLRPERAPANQPLIQGEIIITPHSSSDNQYIIFAKLKLNPTRMAEQLTTRQIVFGVDGDRTLPFKPTRTRVPSSMEGEYVLADADNYLMGDRKISTLNAGRWVDLLEANFSAIERFLANAMTRAASRCGLHIARERSYSLTRLETYWEFQHADAIAGVHGFSGNFRSIGRNAQNANFTLNGLEASTDLRHQNAPSLSIELNARTRLKIYAKTNRRIRVEVDQKKQQHWRTSNSLHGIVQLMQSTSQNVGGLVGLCVILCGGV